MSDRLYRRTEAGIEPYDPATTAARVRYKDTDVASALDALREVTNGSAVATRLQTPREIALAGDASGGALFDGSADIEIVTVVEKITNTELEEMLS